MTDKYGKIHTDGSRSGGQPLDDSIEAKALALVNEVNVERGYAPYSIFSRDFDHTSEALCRAIEQHEDFKQEVSDIVDAYVRLNGFDDWDRLINLIIPKPMPDPLVEVLEKWFGMKTGTNEDHAKDLRAVLDDFGFEIREKG